MRIILFRHGPAGRRDPGRWPDDGERPLTRRGAERTEAAAYGLARFARGEVAIWTSPLLRADATATLARHAFDLEKPLERMDALAPGGSYREVMTRLAAVDSGACIVLVGHEPDLGKLAGMLLFGAPARSLPLKKAGACVIDFAGPVEPGAGHLHAFLPPRALRRTARRRSQV
ncbi:MAG: SixA phosphatase family protein [Candidatus Eisenbacteria bacterium]